MEIEFDQKKNQRNIEERQLSFEMARYFHWDSAMIIADERKDYPEPRFLAAGYVGTTARLHILVFTPIKTGIRVISFRKANAREVKKYEDRKKHTTN
ncbi:BrnT family toxin [Avibacterium sp. 21-599]|uniref:BrnT family toxin n=1 Tax=Avibacterium sp. 21-599 TaxID=2911528 RepID=UPI00224803EA|nr:BrnT family toxin [Avibacterium sp. 21-599]MCW9718324.1 BrnT family toxin [Avibacterium sp. 21-599]